MSSSLIFVECLFQRRHGLAQEFEQATQSALADVESVPLRGRMSEAIVAVVVSELVGPAGGGHVDALLPPDQRLTFRPEVVGDSVERPVAAKFPQ